MKKGSTVKIKYYPKCSSSCKETCPSCIVDTVGRITGKNWSPSIGPKLYEVKYKKEGIKKFLAGVFSEKEIELIKD